MASFEVSRFDPDTDPTRPVVGSIIEHNGQSYKIDKVDHILGRTLLSSIENNEEPTKPPGFDEVLYEQHPSRPFVFWVISINKVTVGNE